MDPKSIEVGQRFERLGRWRRTWEVEAIIQGGAPVANVVLRDLSDPANKCTLAPQALLDGSRFRLIGQAEPQPASVPVRRKARPRRELPPGGMSGGRIVALPRRRQETSMMIETRSPAGYVVICKLQGVEHRFVAKHPGVDLTCPRCGNKAKSMALLLDYIGTAPPWRQISAPSRRKAEPLAPDDQASMEKVRPLEVVDRKAPETSPLAKIFALPRKRGLRRDQGPL